MIREWNLETLNYLLILYIDDTCRVFLLVNVFSCFSNIFTWQTYNALFIIRSLCKYFVENLSEEVVVQQFETKTMDSKGENHTLQQLSVWRKILTTLLQVTDTLGRVFFVTCWY